MIALASILDGLGYLKALEMLLKLPGTIKNLPKYYQDWKDLYEQVIGFRKYVETKYTIEAYPIELVFADAFNRLVVDKREMAEDIVVCGFHEVAPRHRGYHEIPSSYSNTCLVYWWFAFKSSRKYYFQLWDSHLRLLSETITDEDPRIACAENIDIRKV